MSLEIRNNLADELGRAAKDFQEEAGYYSKKSSIYFEADPGSKEVVFSDGATNKRLSEVYQRTAQGVRELYRQHLRNMERALDPDLSELSDPELVEEEERKRASIIKKSLAEIR